MRFVEVPETSVVDLGDLLSMLVRWSWVIVAAMAIVMAKGLWDMHKFQPQHVAKMVVAPEAERSIVNASSGGDSQLARTLLGFGGGARNETPFDRMVHSISTIAFARRMQDKYGLLQVVYASAWDAQEQAWKVSTHAAGESSNRLREFLNLPVSSSPNLEDLAGYLSGSFDVVDVPDTSFKEISFKHRDGELALRLLTVVYSEASQVIREINVEENRSRRKFLKARLGETRIVELREALAALLAQEARQEMMFRGDLPYVGRIIEDPHISKHKTAPDKKGLLYLPLLIAAIVTTLVITIAALFKRE